MVSRQVGTRVLGVRILPNADPALREHLDVRPGDRSLGIFTTDCDDVSYAALDEATKKADVSVAYAKSMYAGAPMPAPLWPVSLSGFYPDRIRRRCAAVWMRRLLT